MIKVLFLCTGNSCRSQMGEGWARHLKAGQIDALSAGIDPHCLNLDAVKVMAEVGIDISSQESQHINEFVNDDIDYVISVCEHADEHCPVFPGDTKVIHRPFDDPPKLAADADTEEKRLAPYRRVRDEIRALVEGMPGNLGETR